MFPCRQSRQIVFARFSPLQGGGLQPSFRRRFNSHTCAHSILSPETYARKNKTQTTQQTTQNGTKQQNKQYSRRTAHVRRNSTTAPASYRYRNTNIVSTHGSLPGPACYDQHHHHHGPLSPPKRLPPPLCYDFFPRWTARTAS